MDAITRNGSIQELRDRGMKITPLRVAIADGRWKIGTS